MTLRCNHDALRVALSQRRELAALELGVLVLDPPPPTEETASALTQLTERGLLDVARWLSAETWLMRQSAGVLVLLQGQAVKPDGLARSVDDGAAALMELMPQQHKHIRFYCIQWRGAALPVDKMASLIAALVAQPVGTQIKQPILFNG